MAFRTRPRFGNGRRVSHRLDNASRNVPQRPHITANSWRRVSVSTRPTRLPRLPTRGSASPAHVLTSGTAYNADSSEKDRLS